MSVNSKQLSVLGDPEDPWSYHKETVPADVPVRLLPQLVQLADSEDPKDQLQGTLLIRKLLSVLENPPLEQVAVSRIALRLLSFRRGDSAVSNLCRSKPSPDLDTVCEALPVIVPLLAHEDEDVAANVCWALAHISDGPPACVERVLNTGALPQIIRLLTSDHPFQQVPALRIVGNIASGDHEQAQLLVTSGVLPPLHDLLQHPEWQIKKEACWALSNIIRGPPEQVQAVINAQLFPVILQCIGAVEYEIKKEAVLCVANLSTGGTPEQIRYVVEELNVFNDLVQVLALYDPKILKVALDALQNLLEAGEDEKERRGLAKNPYVQMFTDIRGFSHLENLESHSNNDVYFAAVTIVDTFFERPEFCGFVKSDSDSPVICGSPPQPDSQPAQAPALGGESEIPTSLAATDSAIQAAITAGIKETTASLQAEVLALRRQLVTVQEQLSVAQHAAMQLSMRLEQI